MPVAQVRTLVYLIQMLLRQTRKGHLPQETVPRKVPYLARVVAMIKARQNGMSEGWVLVDDLTVSQNRVRVSEIRVL